MTTVNNNKNRVWQMVFSALFLALAYVLPFLTGQIPEIGSMLCPMHIPVLLCGFVCGWKWGLAVGLMAPITRSLILIMPPLFPTAVCMALELATYGAVAGLMYRRLPRRKINLWISLLTAMVIGRIVWGGAMFLCVGLSGGTFALSAFVAGAFTNAIPGIILQIVAIPLILMLIERLRQGRKVTE
ncbi:MAG: ECF transporter S component [Clostridia bacterium]|nr:ECF transporter S component [Clostridia bacterium]